MNFRIADTFTDSLGRLTADEQKAAKTTAFDLQVNPASPGLQFHKLDKARDRNFWSVRVGSDIRLIVHRTDGSLLLCYVDHHDKAYQWAERRRLETHPKTGAAQLVEVRETVQEVIVPVYVKQERPAPPKPMLFAEIAAERLLEYGVPVEWLDDVRAATEDSILDLANHLPGEAAEALLCLAVGGKPATRAIVPVETPSPAEVIAPQAFEHPDAQRRFRTVSNIEELERALEFPWEKWTVFLHPAQRETVGRDFSGPARVSGSAGTGKTVVALHRAVFLARANPETRVLLTTFSEILANALRTQLRRLIHKDPRLAERLEVHAIDAIGLRLFKSHFGPARLALREDVAAALKAAAGEVAGHKFSPHFLLTEWEQVVDAWQLDTWESYRDVRRLGRKTRLPEAQRALLWSIFEKVRARLAAKGVVTLSEVFGKVAAAIGGSRNPPFHFAVVDEAQDMGVPHLRFFSALGGDRPNALFFAGDLGQRIFQQPFSWRALGVDIRGRSRTLQVNYRTSHQIRMQADRLLGPDVSDVDGNTEERGHTISVFNGPAPTILVADDEAAEVAAVSAWISELREKGLVPSEFGIFVRSAAQLDRACAAMKASGLPFKVLDDNVETTSGSASIATMHIAKGLEFRAVAVLACDDEVLPLQERIEAVADDADLEDVYNTERHLLYVACTRARDYLLVTGVAPASEYLSDLDPSR
jgi:mRNA-degrading endonuclease RelE of RelBE toxin-antitoxin system